MKLKYLNGFLLIVGMCVWFQPVKAQGDIQALLLAGTEDANVMAEGYIQPFMESFGVGLAGGWANTAKAHNTLGFDLTVTVNAVFIPDEKLFYSPVFQNAGYAPGSIQPSPTFAGPSGVTPTYQYDVTVNDLITGTPQQFVGTFDGPEGLGLKDEIGMQAVPIPMAQLGIGIVKNTDIKLRYTPKIDFGDGEFQLMGFGVMHDIKQHIPGIKMLLFDLSVLFGYTKVTTEYDLTTANVGTGGAVLSTTNGKSTLEMQALTFQALISKKLSIFTFYGGIGYNKTDSNLDMSGEYEITYTDAITGTFTETVSDPISQNFEQNGLRATAGMRIKLAILSLHADYTLQTYNTLSVGVGFTVR